VFAIDLRDPAKEILIHAIEFFFKKLQEELGSAADLIQHTVYIHLMPLLGALKK
jgi:hypothetical protein